LFNVEGLRSVEKFICVNTHKLFQIFSSSKQDDDMEVFDKLNDENEGDTNKQTFLTHQTARLDYLTKGTGECTLVQEYSSAWSTHYSRK
jgi:hypothetical protein